ncbi:hypothetical protein [Pontibacter sp. G13]|uniref:hypothetical protein n=1 Tax=Pontibacter sp. G13 TaxID=3074898 RepID=UPI00288B2312|nr:hypothetical protein [Pontibacter sp. G13]WNJ18656.1 hypothetical protein RJD25_27690 [Pontibacter sp. G13]
MNSSASPTQKLRTWAFKWLNWEFWPMHLVYAPVYLYWLWLSIRARNFLFFAYTNPGIPFGGLFADTKIDILDKIPGAYLPTTRFIQAGTSAEEIMEIMNQADLSFPVILKPNLGERGFLVEKIRHEAQLAGYLQTLHADLVLQEFIGYPEEVSVLYYRFPGEVTGTVSSLTLKQMLQVQGDGQQTLESLVLNDPRALLKGQSLHAKWQDEWNRVLEEGETFILEQIGNHARGTIFLNGHDQIDESLRQTFDQITSDLDGIYFGRYDIKCQSLDHLKRGERFKILEINGVKAEPTHIYQPGYSIWKAYRELFRQWNTIYSIAKANRQAEVDAMSFREGLSGILGHFRQKKLAKLSS